MRVDDFVVDSSSITPLVGTNENGVYETQIIFQRHCNYDRDTGDLYSESIEEEKEIVKEFLNNLILNYGINDLRNTYFLFCSSAAVKNGKKRCVNTMNIAMDIVKEFYKENGISKSHIINMDEALNYKNSIHEDGKLSEPKMFTDSTGYFDYLYSKYGGITKDFWIDFEEDLSSLYRRAVNGEGPDEIVKRAVDYIKTLEKYASVFHINHPNSKLIIWNGTHYDLISPFVKQKVKNFKKSDFVGVDYCGGISVLINKEKEICSNVNGIYYPFDFPKTKQLSL